MGQIKTKRIVELDSLRAIAALNLVLFHFTHVYIVKYGYTSELGFEWPYGKYGVQLFFMLSGFVNAMTLLRKREAGNFLVGRMLRICPSYWTVVLINLAIVGLAPLAISSFSTAEVMANFTIMPNLLGVECIEPVTWTLQIEIIFYGLILLMFVTGALRTPARTVFAVLLMCLVGCGAINYLSSIGSQGPIVNWLTLSRELLILEHFPLFAMGILLNEIKNKRGRLSHNIAGIVASAVVFHTTDRFGHNPAATVLLFALLAASAYGRLPVLRFKPLVFISSISYTLYLLHNNLGSVFIYHVNQAGVPPLLAMLLAIAFAIAVSAAITYYVEQPVTAALKRRWDKIRTGWQNRASAVTPETAI